MFGIIKEGYLSETIENGRWGAASGEIGHQTSLFEVTIQGHLKKGELI